MFWAFFVDGLNCFFSSCGGPVPIYIAGFLLIAFTIWILCIPIKVTLAMNAHAYWKEKEEKTDVEKPLV